jgi:hypothetical protein
MVAPVLSDATVNTSTTTHAGDRSRVQKHKGKSGGARQAVLPLLRSRRQPLTAPAEGGWVEKFKGKFDLGWNAMREQIFANQKRLGVIPDNAKLTEWPDSLPKWDTLSADQKKLFARQAEVYAGYTAYTDYEIGRVIQAVEDMGQLDNTLIIYICGDNGTSPEGTLSGTPNQYTSYNGILDLPIAEQLKFYDGWGSAGTYPHMAVAWSWAFDTPFKYTKQIAFALWRHTSGYGHLVAEPHQGYRRGTPPALLFGAPLDSPAAVGLARVGGAAILALAMVCWLARRDVDGRASRGLVAAMTFYNAAVAAVLALCQL